MTDTEQAQAPQPFVGQPPDDVDGMDQDGVEKAIYELRNAAASHPVHNTHDPRHDEWAAHRDALYAAAVDHEKADAEDRQRQAGERALDEIERTPPVSDALADRAAKVLADCREAGFDDVPDSPPEDLREDQIRTWELQLMHSRATESGDENSRAAARRELVTALGEQLKAAGAKGETLELLRQFSAADVDEELRDGIFGQLIAAVHRAGAATRGPARLDRDAPIEDQIAALRATPGYGDAKLRDADRPQFDKITKALTALYGRQVQEEQGQ